MAKRTAAELRMLRTIKDVKENPFDPRVELFAMYMDAVLDLWNEDIAGEIELEDGSCVTVQPVIHKGY